jgi:glycosyltransferase involved in cell wall biosynthesis
VGGSRADLRVCHIVSGDLWAGSEVHVATMTSYLAERSDVKVSAVLLNDAWLARELRRSGVDVTIVDEAHHNALQILEFLVRYLRRSRVDVVHTHRYKETILGSIAAKLAGVPHLIRTVQLGMFDVIPRALGAPVRPWERVKSTAYELLDRAVLSCFADRIVTVSRRMADALQACGYDAQTVSCIHNGVDLRTIQAAHSSADVRRRIGVEPDALVIGNAARLAPVKGQAFLLRAAKLVLEQEPRARFVFVGSGSLKNQLMDLAAALGIDRACRFIDRVTDLGLSVYDVIAAMDIFTLPSLDEGTPLALMEAMALKRPVVVTPVGGVPEIVTDGVTGLIVPPRDEQKLAAACLTLTRDRALAHTLGENARRTVEVDFSRERNGEAWLQLYRDLVRDTRATDHQVQGARASALP